ncbi:hypothetical protein LCGC14_2859600 [marine sediment metagenome]|uniref:Potassium channel domain-containing protein n=1 Tax=marine sediment metagenome TaxID=412755 RepID=A0A0F9AX22_9ZZZZ
MGDVRDVQGALEDQLAGAFFPLFILLVAFLLVAPLLDGSAAGRITLSFLFYVAMLVAIRASVGRRIILFLVFVVSAFAWVMFAFDQIFDIPALEVAHRILSPALLFVTALTVLAGIIRVERGTMNTVFGAVCAYFLIALFWAFIFFQTERIDPGSFTFPDGPHQRLSDFVYFAFVTQTTLGYGDITPVSDYARSFAMMAAFLGQVYLVVTVARMVSLQVAYSGRVAGTSNFPPPADEAAPQGTASEGRASGERPQDSKDRNELDES